MLYILIRNVGWEVKESNLLRAGPPTTTRVEQFSIDCGWWESVKACRHCDGGALVLVLVVHDSMTHHFLPFICLVYPHPPNTPIQTIIAYFEWGRFLVAIPKSPLITLWVPLIFWDWILLTLITFLLETWYQKKVLFGTKA